MGNSPLCCAVADDGEDCQAASVAGAPVALCGPHLRMSYEFAHEMVTAARSYAPVGSAPSTGIESQPLDAADRRIVFRPLQRARAGESLVYFLRFGDRIKIGFTTNLKARMKAVPHDELLATMPGTMDDEKRLHGRFARLRVNNEWFRVSPELLAFIAEFR